MHGVLITFASELGAEDVAAPFADYAEALGSVDGLYTKAWLATDGRSDVIDELSAMTGVLAPVG